MRHIIYTLVASVVLGSATFVIVRRIESAPQSVRRAFTAKIFEQRYTETGTLARSEYSIHAVRGDGSQVDVYNREDPNGGPMNWKAVVDLPSRRRIVVEPVTGSLVSFLLADIHVNHYLRINHPCTVPADAPKDRILGYEVVRIQTENHGPGPAFHLENWVAPAVDCFPLRHFYKVGSGDAPGSHNTREVVQIIEGEPAPSLFELPAGYVKRSPAEADDLFSQRFPGIRPFGTDVDAGKTSPPSQKDR